MEIVVANAVESTWVVIAIAVVVLLVTSRKSQTLRDSILPPEVTQELKGLAIFTIVFGHIGYFLVDDNRFLFPLSIAAGVGVNLFLFLSGYGLTVGMMKKRLPALEFYRHRLSKIFIPFWLVLSVFFLMDAFILQRMYPAPYYIRSLFGLFPRADVAIDVNSVFWYITWILLYYLLFPFVFSAKRPWLSALILFGAGSGLVLWNPSAWSPVMHLYRVHTIAFPLGMLLAVALREKENGMNPALNAIRHFKRAAPAAVYYGLLIILTTIACYTAYYSGVGQGALKEQLISIVTTCTLVALFALKRFEIGLFAFTGFYSYEIYLLHWPLLSRYDIFYRHTPAWLATVLYLALFFGLGWLIQKATTAFEENKLLAVKSK